MRIERDAPNNFKPAHRKLFNSVASQAIYQKNISYDLNKQAKNFGELFGIHLDQYTLDNFKANSCYLNLLVDTWHSQFEKRKSTGKRMYSELTYESVCQTIGIENMNQDIGISLHESIKLFDKYHLGIDVVNIYGQMLFTHRPDKLNDHIFPQVLRVLVHNSHTYPLDHNAKGKLAKLRTKFQNNEISIDEINTLTVSNKFRLRLPSLDNYDVHMIDRLHDCVQIIQECADEEKETRVRFITNNNLLDILFEMVHEKYTPLVIFAGCKITSLGFKVGKVEATIECTDSTAPEDSTVELDSKELYQAYHKADDEFYAPKFLKRD